MGMKLEFQPYQSPQGWYTLQYPEYWEMEVIEGIPTFYDPQGSGAVVISAFENKTGDYNPEVEMRHFLSHHGIEYDIKNIFLFENTQGSIVQTCEFISKERFWFVYKNTQWWQGVIPEQDKVIEINEQFLNLYRILKKIDYKILLNLVSFYRIMNSYKKPLDKLFAKNGIDVVIIPFQNGINTRFKSIYFPHDFQHEYYPENFTLLELIIRRVLWKKMAHKASAIICESKHVASDIVKYWKVDQKKIFIIITPPNYKIVSKKNEKNNLKPYFIYPSSDWPHKNIEILIYAFAILNKKGFDYSLVLTNVKLSKNLVEIIKKNNIQEKIVILGNINEANLIQKMKNARGIVVPSLFESLSLPIYEGIALGIPVACSDIEIFRYQAIDNAIFFNPHSAEDISNKLIEMCKLKSENRFEQNNIDFLESQFLISLSYAINRALELPHSQLQKDSYEFMKKPENIIKILKRG